MSLLLAACSADQNNRITANEPPPPPTLERDIEICPTKKDPGAIKKWTVSEVETLLEIERGKIDKLNGCLIRLICSTKDYRAKISKVEGETLCGERR